MDWLIDVILALLACIVYWPMNFCSLVACSVLKKEWILAKYQREEFTDPDRQSAYNCAYKEGMLWKLGRDRKQFQLRKFVLSRAENKFSYFVTDESSKQVCLTWIFLLLRVVFWCSLQQNLFLSKTKVYSAPAQNDRQRIRTNNGQEQQENFLLQGQLFVLTYFSIYSTPCYRSST